MKGGIQLGEGPTRVSWLRFALLAGCVSLLWAAGGLDFLERQIEGLRFSLLDRPASGTLVLVAIDSPSLKALGPWPWTRERHAELLDRLVDAGARRVAFATDFAIAGDPAGDAAFAARLERHPGRVVLPIVREWDHDASLGARLVMHGPPEAMRQHARLGLIGSARDADGLTRRYDTRIATGEGHLPALSVGLLDQQAQLPDSLLLDYGIDPASIPRVSYAQVLAGDHDAAMLRDRLVLVGPTALELAEFHTVPRFGRMPAVSVEALAYESLLQDRAIGTVPRWIIPLGCLGLALLSGRCFQTADWRTGLWVAVAVAAGLFLLTVALLGEAPILLDASPWIVTVAGCYSLELLSRVDRQRLRLLTQGRRMQQSEALMRHVVENSFDAVITLSHNGTITTANPSARQIFGVGEQALIGRNVRDLVAFSDDTGLLSGPAVPSLGLVAAAPQPCEVVGRRESGAPFPIELTLSAMNSEGLHLYVACMRDITQRKAQQELLHHQATHDGLTDLPNRYLLEERLENCLAVARNTRGPLALLLLDLDRFKDINETLGHHTGDVLLQHVAERLQGALRPGDTVARLGGDEFALLLVGYDEIAARQLAEELARLLAMPFDADGLMLQVDTAMGIALYPDHGTDTETLFQHADVAMYTAKRNRTGVAMYAPGQDAGSVRQFTLTGELRRAIDAEIGLSLMYQPKVDARTTRVVGAEALIRWNHERLGNIRPDEFIGLAENSGLIRPLTRWVLRTALEQCALWQKQGLPLGISVNISARNLLEQELPESLARLLAECAVPASRLTLEITENVIMENPERALEVVTELATMGIVISIDDFGTGYSSLGYLRRLPAREIKIDRCFITDMDRNPDDATIVRSTIDLAHNLGRRVVAEGVERREIWESLRNHGCDVGQGYFFSKPLPPEALTEWLRGIEAPQAQAQALAEVELEAEAVTS